MAEQRRKKVVRTQHSQTEKSGSRADVIRPHKRTSNSGTSSSASSSAASSTAASSTAASSSAPTTVTIGQFLTSYLASQKASSYSDTVWGSNLAKKESSVRKLLSIPADDTVYLAAEVSVLLRGKVALALCDTGVRMRDLTGTVSLLPWSDLRGAKIGYQNTTLVIGSHQLAFHDAEKLAKLLAQIQSKLA